MDVFMEYIVKHKKEAKDIIIIALIIAGATVLSLALLVGMFALAYALAGQKIMQFGFSIGFVIIALCWYAAYLLINTRSIEYEYILTNSDMDIDKIMSKKGRKHVVSFNFTNIDICARVDDNMHNDALKREEPDRKVYDLTGDRSRGGVYFVDYFDDEKSQKVRVLFQPTSRMLDEIRKFNPRNIFVS